MWWLMVAILSNSCFSTSKTVPSRCSIWARSREVRTSKAEFISEGKRK